MSEETPDRETVRGPSQPDREPEVRAKRRWVPVLLVLLIAGLVALRAALPTVIERGLAWIGPRKLGVSIRLENADLALWRGNLVLEGLVVGPSGEERAGPDPERALLRWDRLGLTLDWGSLRKGRIHLREIALTTPVLRIPVDAQGRPVLPEPPPGDESAADEGVDSEAASDGEKDAGWPLQIDAFSLSGLEVRLVQEGVEIDPLFFALEALRVENLALVGGDVGLGGISLAGPQLRIRRDFILRDDAEPGAEPVEDAGSLDAFAAHRLEAFAIDDARFTWITNDGPVEVTLGVRARDVSARRDEPFEVAIDLGLEGGSANLVGRLGLNPVTFAGSFSWHELPLVRLVRATDPSLAAWSRTGTGSGELQIDARVDGGAQAGVKLSGRIGSADFEVSRPGDEELAVAWKSLDVEIAELFWPLGANRTTPARIALARVELREPRLLYTQPAPPPAATPPGEGGSPETSPPEDVPVAGGEVEPGADELPEIIIGVLEVGGGEISFRDHSIEPPYAAELSNLAIRASQLRWPKRRATGIDITGTAPKTASFRLTGSLDDTRGDFHLRLDGLALPPFNPYAQNLAGYRVAGGNASVTTEIEMRGERYRIDSDIVLHKLDMSGDDANFAARFGVNLDLALALMRDINGDIALPIHVRIVPEARTRLGPLVLAALRQAVLGAITSPLKLVGAALDTVTDGGGEIELAPGRIEGAPGQVHLPESAQPRLQAWAELLASRPALALAVGGEAGATDRDGIARRLLVERAGAGEALPDLADTAFFARRRVWAALQAQGRGEAVELEAEDATLLERYVAAVEVPPARFEALAEERAAAARQALIERYGVDAARVVPAPPRSDGEPGVQIDLRTTGP